MSPLPEARGGDPHFRYFATFAQPACGKLVSITISHDPPPKPSGRASIHQGIANHWRLQEAKARFSELVRRVRSDGPQHVTVHGRDEVVVVSADDYARLQGEPSGTALIEALQASPHRDTDLVAPSVRATVRKVEL